MLIQTRKITNNGLRMLYSSPDTPRHPPLITDQHKDGGGWIGRWGMPKVLPQWLSEEDLDYSVGEFSRAGFRGGLNYYATLTPITN